jgi:GT2 family glycosyltransferase
MAESAENRNANYLDNRLTVGIITCCRPIACVNLLSQVMSQGTLSDRVIVVDDAPPESVLFSYHLAGVQVLRTLGQGAAAARNAVLAACKTEWILFIDDDVSLLDDVLPAIRARIQHPDFDVLTANVLSGNCEIGRLYDERFPLSRGPGVAVYFGTTGTCWSPNDVWRVGVGACMAWRVESLRRIGGFAVPLGQGRRFGGAEDLEAFRRALRKGLVIRYDGTLVVRHESPRTLGELHAKMRDYALALGAFAAHVWIHERQLGMALHVLRDVLDCPTRTIVESVRKFSGRAHLPIRGVAGFPFLAAKAFVGYLKMWGRSPDVEPPSGAAGQRLSLLSRQTSQGVSRNASWIG